MKKPIAAFASLLLTFLSLSQPALAQGNEGTATGTIVANGKSVAMKFAQARKVGSDWEVLLSDAPTSFGDTTEREKVESGQLHSLTLTVGSDGEVSYWRMAHNAMEARYFATSSVSSSKATTLGPASVEGSARKTPSSYGDNTVGFDVTFKAPVAKK